MDYILTSGFCLLNKTKSHTAFQSLYGPNAVELLKLKYPWEHGRYDGKERLGNDPHPKAKNHYWKQDFIPFTDYSY